MAKKVQFTTNQPSATTDYLAADNTWKTIPGGGSGIPKGTTSGTDTYTTTISGVSAYNDGDAYLIRFANGNTTQCTLNINSLGAKAASKSLNTLTKSAKALGLAFGVFQTINFSKKAVRAFADDERAAGALSKTLQNLLTWLKKMNMRL